jgi:rubrerythrin
MGRKKKEKPQKNLFVCPICLRVFPATLFRPNRQVCPRCEMASKKEPIKIIQEKQKQYIL